jgi:hypothetical protein
VLDLCVGGYNTEIRSSHVVEICAVLEYYAVYNGNSVLTFLDCLLVLSSAFKNSWSLKMGPVACLGMVVMNYYYKYTHKMSNKMQH